MKTEEKQQSHFTIRNYEEKDWPRLMEIHDAARKMELQHAGLEQAFVPLEIAAEREGLFEYTVCVACEGENVVGFVAYAEDELAWLYVDPACMHCGIGKSLVNYVLEHDVERPLLIEVLEGNIPAVKLYESCGFEIRETASGVMPGNEEFAVRAYVMQKKD